MKRLAILVAMCALAACAPSQPSKKDLTHNAAALQLCSNAPTHANRKEVLKAYKQFIACLKAHHVTGIVEDKTVIITGTSVKH